MSMIAIPAYFDGQQICLDEPFEMKRGTKMIITILSQRESNEPNKIKGAYEKKEFKKALNLTTFKCEKKLKNFTRSDAYNERI